MQKKNAVIFLLTLFFLVAVSLAAFSQTTDTAKASKPKTDTTAATITPKKDTAVTKVKADTTHVHKKKHKLFAFVGKMLHKEEAGIKKQAVPNVAGAPQVNKPPDTTKGGSKVPAVKSPVSGLGSPVTGIPGTGTDSTHKTPTAQRDTVPPHRQGFFSKLDKFASHGNVSVGYDYGVLPFASNLQVPMGYVHSEGQGQFNLGILPFNGSYYYSDLNTISGLNNYVRLSFDAQKFKQEYMDKESGEEQKLKGELGQLYKARQLAEQKLLYLQSIQNQPGIKAPQTPSVNSPNVSAPSTSNLQKDASADSLTPKPQLPKTDSLSKSNSSVKPDSTAPKSSSLKSDSAALKPSSLKSDSAAALKSLNKSSANNAPVRDADSVKADIEKYQKEIDNYDKEIDKTSSQMNTIKRDETAAEHNNPYIAKIYNVMSGFKKLEVGLCYPDYSTFLINGMAVKGINAEYQKQDVYVAATEGTTVNTLLFTNNAVQNRLVNMQNLYNMFDFQAVQNGRKVLALKTGWGEKEGTHFFVGFMYGTGLPSYLNNYVVDPTSGLSKNYVLELDGKWAITSNSSFNLVYGKSSTQTTGNYYDITDGGVFKSDHSKAILGKYNLKLKKTKTNITLTGRWIDPFFNSFGVGYMRADNFRYEIKTEQPFSKKIKVSVFYRKDEDDVLELYQFHTVLQTIGANTTIKLMRSLTLRIGYTPVIEHVWGSDPVYDVFNNNNICNLVLTYTPIIRGLNLVINGSYNYYRLTTDTQTIAFQNFSFSITTKFKNSLSNNIAVNWFKTTPTDSMNNNVWMLSDDISYTFLKGFTVTIGGKAAWSPITDSWQYGYEAKLKVPLIKHLSCEFEGEKLVIGDFYNSFDILQIEKFPYYCQGKLTYSW